MFDFCKVLIVLPCREYEIHQKRLPFQYNSVMKISEMPCSPRERLTIKKLPGFSLYVFEMYLELYF